MKNDIRTINSDIIIVSKYSIPKGYGISSKSYQIAKYLSKSESVTLITSNSNHLSEFPFTRILVNTIDDDSLSVKWLKVLQYNKSKSIRRLLSWVDFELKLRLLSIDAYNPPKLIVVSSLSLLTILWGLKLKKRFGTKVVFEIRDIYPMMLTAELAISKYNPIVLILSYIEKKGYRESDLIIGTMPKLNDHVENVLGDKKEVFYSPIGLSGYHNIHNDNESVELNIPLEYKDSLIVGYSGSLGESNYLGSFIRTIANLKDCTKFFFVIVGSGDYLERYKEELADYKNSTFTGRIPPDLVQSYLKSFDCLYLSVKPSIIWEYGQSMNKVLDYLMAGKPIIAAYDGYPNMLAEIEGNLIIPSNDDQALADALETVSKYDEAKLKSIAINAPKLVLEHYTYDVINERYYQRIKKLIS